jgi:hypothetical protein
MNNVHDDGGSLITVAHIEIMLEALGFKVRHDVLVIDANRRFHPKMIIVFYHQRPKAIFMYNDLTLEIARRRPMGVSIEIVFYLGKYAWVK